MRLQNLQISGIDFGKVCDYSTEVILEITGNFKAPIPNDTKWQFVKAIVHKPKVN
jgi:hypothetical protein